MHRLYGMTILGIIITAFLLTACASPPLKVVPIAKSENPTDQMENLGQGILAARQNKVDVLSTP